MNQTATATSMRSILEAIVSKTEPSRVGLEALHRLAAVAVAGDEAQDAVADFMETVISATRRNGAASAQALLALPDAELVAITRHRLRQHAVGRRPLWALLKSLREHVKACLDAGLPPPIEPPSTLLRGDRLASDLVAAATAYTLAFEPDVDQTPAGIAKHLLNAYFKPTDEPGTEVTDAQTQARRNHDALKVSADLREHLGPDLLRLLRSRHQGLGLAEIAARERIAVSTAHARIQAAIERLREYTLAARTSRETGRLALLLLAD